MFNHVVYWDHTPAFIQFYCGKIMVLWWLSCLCTLVFLVWARKHFHEWIQFLKKTNAEAVLWNKQISSLNTGDKLWVIPANKHLKAVSCSLYAVEQVSKLQTLESFESGDVSLILLQATCLPWSVKAARTTSKTCISQGFVEDLRCRIWIWMHTRALIKCRKSSWNQRASVASVAG